jgi:hypothetical protein
VALFAVAACGDTAERGPLSGLRTPGQVICTTQCRKSNDYCAESCGLEYKACISDAQAAGQRQYELYATQKHASGQAVDRRPSEFEVRAPCDEDRNYCRGGCEKRYSSCYTSCGG